MRTLSTILAAAIAATPAVAGPRTTAIERTGKAVHDVAYDLDLGLVGAPVLEIQNPKANLYPSR